MRLAVVVVIVIIVIVFLLVLLTRNAEQVQTLPDITTNDLFGKVKINTIPQIKFKTDEYRAFNPSLVEVGNEIMYVYRVSNATGCHKSSHEDKFLTANNPSKKSFITLSNGVKSVNVSVKTVGGMSCSKGYEDPRVILSSDGEVIYIIANALTGDSCRNQMWLLQISTASYKKSLSEGKESLIPDNILSLKTDFDLDVPQKNWMPFIKNEDLMFVYSINPHVILKCDFKTGHCKEVSRLEYDDVPKDLRGGSQAVLYNDKYIAAIHRRTKEHSYLTQFYTFETRYPFEIIAITDDFKISDGETEPDRIQFVAGLQILERDGEDVVVLTYGEEDCYSRECEIPMSRIELALE